jgi:hypothetical protein
MRDPIHQGLVREDSHQVHGALMPDLGWVVRARVSLYTWGHVGEEGELPPHYKAIPNWPLAEKNELFDKVETQLKALIDHRRLLLILMGGRTTLCNTGSGFGRNRLAA